MFPRTPLNLGLVPLQNYGNPIIIKDMPTYEQLLMNYSIMSERNNSLYNENAMLNQMLKDKGSKTDALSLQLMNVQKQYDQLENDIEIHKQQLLKYKSEYEVNDNKNYVEMLQNNSIEACDEGIRRLNLFDEKCEKAINDLNAVISKEALSEFKTICNKHVLTLTKFRGWMDDRLKNFNDFKEVIMKATELTDLIEHISKFDMPSLILIINECTSYFFDQYWLVILQFLNYQKLHSASTLCSSCDSLKLILSESPIKNGNCELKDCNGQCNIISTPFRRPYADGIGNGTHMNSTFINHTALSCEYPEQELCSPENSFKKNELEAQHGNIQCMTSTPANNSANFCLTPTILEVLSPTSPKLPTEIHYDFLNKHGKYNVLYSNLKEQLAYPSESIVKALLQVKQSNNNCLSFLTHMQILDKVKEELKTESSSTVPQLNLNIHKDSYETCRICFQSIYMSGVKKLTCKHIFHKQCIKTWLKKNSTCPICRILVVK